MPITLGRAVRTVQLKDEGPPVRAALTFLAGAVLDRRTEELGQNGLDGKRLPVAMQSRRAQQVLQGGSHAARVHMLAACGLAAAVDRGEAESAERRVRMQAAGIAGALAMG